MSVRFSRLRTTALLCLGAALCVFLAKSAALWLIYFYAVPAVLILSLLWPVPRPRR